MQQNKKPIKASRIALYITLSLLALITFVPFWMMLVNAGRSQVEILSGFSLLPSGKFVENWKAANQMANLTQGFFNSLFIAATSTGLQIYFSTMVAYGFAVYKFKYKKTLFTILLISMMVPAQLSFLGFYELCKTYGLINSYIPLIIPSIASAGTVFFLRQYADQVLNKEVIESARIDGASELKIFHQVMMPIFVPAMSTMAIFSFIGSWNNYLTPLLIINKDSMKTLPLMINYISGAAALNPTYAGQGAIYMAIFVSTLPILIVFIIFSRKIINGLAAGSVKG